MWIKFGNLRVSIVFAPCTWYSIDAPPAVPTLPPGRALSEARRIYAKLASNVAARPEILYNNCRWYATAPRCLLSPQAKFANIFDRPRGECGRGEGEQARIKLVGVSSYLCSICKNGIQYLKIYESMNLACYLLVCVSVCASVRVCVWRHEILICLAS